MRTTKNATIRGGRRGKGVSNQGVGNRTEREDEWTRVESGGNSTEGDKMTGTQEKQIKKRDEPNRRTQFEANLEDHTRTAACLTRLLLLELMRLRTSTRSSSRASSSRSTRRLIFVVPANLPNKLLERLVDIPSGLCRCFDELTSELLGECRTLYGNAITKSGKMVSGSVVRSKSGRKLGVPCVCTCLS